MCLRCIVHFARRPCAATAVADGEPSLLAVAAIATAPLIAWLVIRFL